MNNANVIKIIIAVIVLGGIGLIATKYIDFGTPTNKTTTVNYQQSLSPTPQTIVVKVGDTGPDFSVITLDKETFRLSDKKGKIVILFGMAGWCSTCIPEGRALTKIKQEYSNKRVEIIGVAFTKGDNNDFLNEYKKIGGIDIPVALDTDNVAQKYSLTKLETTYIINKDGVVVYKDEQQTTYEDYKRELDKVI